VFLNRQVDDYLDAFSTDKRALNPSLQPRPLGKTAGAEIEHLVSRHSPEPPEDAPPIEKVRAHSSCVLLLWLLLWLLLLWRRAFARS